MGGEELFCIIAAGIIVATRLILEAMEENDRRRGIPVDPKEYRITGLLSIMIKDRTGKILAFIKGALWKKRKKQ